MNRLWIRMLVVGAILLAPVARAADGPVKTEIQKTADGQYELLRDGKPYFIKGVGGKWSRETLAKTGANSFRTWHIAEDLEDQLDVAQKNGLTVTVGYWLKHKEKSFNYSDAAAVAKQFEDVKNTVMKYKHHQAVLAWAVGNEMERNNDIPELWIHIESLAKVIHEIDPNHPVMTVVAELGGKKVQNINKYCPSLDLIGINTYAGGPSVGERYRKNGGTKPFVLTEFGPAGQWEMPKNKFGAVNELTSTDKCKWYRNTYEKSVLAFKGTCLGSYAFIWGFKVEATSTWYGMFLPDGSKLAAVDTMQELWTGKPSDQPCPIMSKLALTGANEVAPGDSIEAIVDVSHPKDGKLRIEWALCGEQGTYGIAGPDAEAAPVVADAIVENGQKHVTIKMPIARGVYRIYCYVRNENGGAAVGSLPVKVGGDAHKGAATSPSH